MATVAAKTKIKSQPILEHGNIFEHTAFWGLCLVLFLAPFFRGLFFAQEQRAALLFAATIFWLACLISYQRKDQSFFTSPLDYLVLGLPLVYLASTFTAANYDLAVDEVVENLLYFIVFWSARRLIRSEKNIKDIFLVIYLSAIVVSLAGLFTASGFLEIKDGFLTSDGGTIASTFQYKNSLASFLTAAIFISSYLRSELSNHLYKIAATIGSFLLLTVLFSTQSHGGYIIFGIFTVLLFFLSPVEKRFDLIVTTLALSFLGLISSKMFLSNLAEKHEGLAWLWIMAGVALVSLGQWAVTKCIKKEIQVSLRQLSVGTAIITLIGLVALGYLGVFQIILEKIHMHGAMERLTMYQDGLRMVQEKPFLGWGGGGWSEAYSIFQGYAYTARQTHSYFLQLAIETGLVGLLIALSIWAVFITKAVKVYKASLNRNGSQSIVATLVCSVLAIISHALFDFDLSLSALTIVMFTLMACLVTLDTQPELSQREKQGNNMKIDPGIRMVISTIAVLVIVTINLVLISSNNLSSAAVTAIRSGNGSEAVNLINKAITMNPLASQNYVIASQLQGALGKKELALENAEKAVQLAQYNPDRLAELAALYVRSGQNDKAVASVRKAIELAPLRVSYYELLSSILTSAAINELKTGNPDAALAYIKQTLSIPEDITAVLDSVHPDKKKLWVYAQPLTVTDKIKLNLGIAEFLSGNIEKAAASINTVAQNPKVQKETLLWQALIAQKQGDQNKVQETLQMAQKDNPNIKKQFDELSTLKLLAYN